MPTIHPPMNHRKAKFFASVRIFLRLLKTILLFSSKPYRLAISLVLIGVFFIPSSLIVIAKDLSPAEIADVAKSAQSKIPKLELDPNYKAKDVKNTNLDTAKTITPPYESGIALDPKFETAEISKTTKDSKEFKIKDIADSNFKSDLQLKRNTAKEDIAKSTDKSKEFVANDGTRFAEQKLFSNKILNEKDEKVELDTKVVEKTEKGEKYLTQGNGKLKPEYRDIATQGVNVKTPAGDVIFKALEAQKSVPTIDADAVVYKNVWDGVDVVYEYQGDAIKEFIVINKKIKTNTFSFQVDGATMTNSEKVKNEVDLKINGKDARINPVNIAVTKLGPISEDIISQSAKGNILTITLDQKWIDSLQSDNYPLSIDPGIIYGSNPVQNGTAFYSYKSDGYICNYDYCDMNTGGILDQSGNYKNSR